MAQHNCIKNLQQLAEKAILAIDPKIYKKMCSNLPQIIKGLIEYANVKQEALVEFLRSHWKVSDRCSRENELQQLRNSATLASKIGRYRFSLSL